MIYLMLCLIGMIFGMVMNVYVFKIERQMLNKPVEILILPLICTICQLILYLRFKSKNELIINSLFILLINAITLIDVKSKQISFRSLLILYTFAVSCLIVVKHIPFSDAVLACILTGAFLIVLSRITGEGIGLGDVLLISGAGLFMGVSKIFSALAVCSVLCGVFGMLLIVINRNNKKKEIPFTPFILIGIISTFLTI